MASGGGAHFDRGFLMLVGVSVGASLVGAGAVVLLVLALHGMGLRRNAPEKPGVPPAVAERPDSRKEERGKTRQAVAADESPRQPRPRRYTDASQSALRIEGVKVSIERARYGHVRARDRSGKIITSDEKFLIISLEVSNQSQQPREYQSWYGNEFAAANGEVQTARLSDSRGEYYTMMSFTDVSDLQGHQAQAVLEPRQSLEDVLIFRLPQEFSVGGIGDLQLDLPGAAIRLEGTYRFKIPSTMIQW